jgi:hypothetical protein
MAFDITMPSLLSCPSNAAAAAADHVAWLPVESVASLKHRKYSDALRAKRVAFHPLVVDVFLALLIGSFRIQSITSPAFVLLHWRWVNYFRPWLLSCSKELVSLFTGRSVFASSPGVTSLLSNRFFVNLFYFAVISFCIL